MDPKNTKITHESIYVLYCLYKKFWSQTAIRPSLWLQILPNPSQHYDSSFEIPRFVNIVRDRLSKTFSIFYHGLHVWYHEILTNLMIFRPRLLFYILKTNRPHVHGRVSWTRCVKFLFISWVRPRTRLSDMNIIFY